MSQCLKTSLSNIKYACPFPHIYMTFKHSQVTLCCLSWPTTSFLKSNESGFGICSSRNMISIRLPVWLAALQWVDIQLMAKCLLRSMEKWSKSQHWSYSSSLFSSLRRHLLILALWVCGHVDSSLWGIHMPNHFPVNYLWFRIDRTTLPSVWHDSFLLSIGTHFLKIVQSLGFNIQGWTITPKGTLPECHWYVINNILPNA